MRVLFTSHLFYDEPGYSGGSWINALMDLLKDNKGIDVGIIYPSYSRNEPYCANGISYFPVKIRLNPFIKIKHTFCTSAQLVKDDNTVKKYVEYFKPDIIQMFGLETIVSSIVKCITTVPVVVHIQGICEPCLKAWFPKEFTKYNVWSRYPFKQRLFRKTIVDKYYRFRNLTKIEKDNYRCYHYYLGRTQWDQDMSLKNSPNRKYYVCNEVIRYDFYEQTWHKKEGLRLVSINNGELYKGFDTILLAAHSLTKKGFSFVWDVYGISANAPIIKIVEEILGYSFNENNVRFNGKKTASELAKELSKATFYVHPSHVDNSPNSLCEAQIVGTPTVSTYIGGIPSLVKDGVTGYLFDDGDFEQLSNIIAGKYMLDDELNNISLNAKHVALLRHDRRGIVENLLKTYQEIILDFNEYTDK